MKRRIPVVLMASCALAAAALLALPGCVATYTGVSLVPSGTPALAASQPAKVDGVSGAINAFGLDLLKATSAAADVPGGNVIVSPASVHAALSMTANGAAAETEQQMRTVLHTDAMTPAEANAQWAALLGGLAGRSKLQTLEVANALWARKDVAFKKPFLDADRDYFGAEVSTLDFAKDDVAGAINAWVSRSTHKMITKMVDQVPGAAILYLANAVYFKGNWVTPFDHEATGKETFTRADGTKVDVDMMHESGPMPYAQNASLQATRLLYEGLDTGYYVMLPREGVSLDAAMASLKGSGFADLRTTLQSPDTTEVVLGLPKLDTEFFAELSKPLTQMGMPRAFSDTDAQFSGMADLGVPIFISRVLHKTKVKVDEKGTEAAAATVVEMTAGTAMQVVEPPRIVCDRPYLFAIVDEKSGAMLFLGAVGDPTK